MSVYIVMQSKTFNVNAVLDYMPGYPCTVNTSQPHYQRVVDAAKASKACLPIILLL
jgi:hypothetical protein